MLASVEFFLSSIIYSLILNTVKLQIAFHKKYSNFILIYKYDWHDFSNSFSKYF